MGILVTEQDVRLEVARIKASPAFAGSARLVQLLDYLVDETLAGRGGQIKAYSIGIDVFGRSDQFDPSSDAIVRVHAGRLRDALTEYYRQTPAGVVVISLPKGGYLPTFQPASMLQVGCSTAKPLETKSVPERPSRRLPGLASSVEHLRSRLRGFLQTNPALKICAALVAIGTACVLIAMTTSRTTPGASRAAINSIGIIPFEDRSGSRRMEPFVRAVEGAVASLLVTAGDFTVRMSPRIEDQSPNVEPSATGAQLPVRWLFMGQLLDFAGRVQIDARVADAETRELVWLGSIDIQDSSSASAVSLALIEQMRPHLFSAIRRTLETQPIVSKDPLELFFLANWAWGARHASLDWEEERIAYARQAVMRDPRFGPAYGVLADKIAYLARVQPQWRTERLQNEARSAAMKAVEYSPRHSETIFNVALHYWHSGDIDQARAFARRTLDLNPAHIMAKLQTIRLRSVCQARPEVMEEIVQFDSQLPATSPVRWVSQMAMMEQYILAGRAVDAAAAGMSSMRDFSNPIHAIWVAAALANVGKMDEAKSLLSQQRQSWPALSPADYVRSELKRRCGDEPPEMLKTFFSKVAPL